MPVSRVRLRYNVPQLVAAVERTKGDSRWCLVNAAVKLPIELRESALEQILPMDLKASDRFRVISELVRLDPGTYLPQLLGFGLRSPSINVQQSTVALLPEIAGYDLDPQIMEPVVAWLRRRLAKPTRATNWAMWEIPSPALALLPLYGTERTAALLRELVPAMQPEERERWCAAESQLPDSGRFQTALLEWSRESNFGCPDEERRDPTADIIVERVMKRLKIAPDDPSSPVYDPYEGVHVREWVIDARDPHWPDEVP